MYIYIYIYVVFRGFFCFSPASALQPFLPGLSNATPVEGCYGCWLGYTHIYGEKQRYGQVVKKQIKHHTYMHIHVYMQRFFRYHLITVYTSRQACTLEASVAQAEVELGLRNLVLTSRAGQARTRAGPGQRNCRCGSLFPSLPPSLSPSLSLSVSLSLSLPLPLCMHVYIYIYVSMTKHTYCCKYTYTHTYMHFYRYTDIPIYIYIYTIFIICLSTYLSVQHLC